MKIIKRILIGILGLIVLLLIIALFVPNQYTVTTTETVNRPSQEVFDYVKILENQRFYSVWLMKDPQLKPEIVGTDGTVGAIQKWNSANEDVGEGEQEITALTSDRMDVDLRFIRPFKGEAKAAMMVKSTGPDQTLVTSEFYSDSKYPFNLPAYVFGKKMMFDAETQNLKNIKQILEKGK
jgi:hypothetical protein